MRRSCSSGPAARHVRSSDRHGPGRCGELLGLRWRNVHLADPDGAVLRVAETFVRGQPDSPKSEKGERTIALGQRIAAELFEHRSRSAFDGDDE